MFTLKSLLQERIKAEAARTATARIQGYIGSDHKVMSMPNFHSALAQALEKRASKARSITATPLLHSDKMTGPASAVAL